MQPMVTIFIMSDKWSEDGGWPYSQHSSLTVHHLCLIKNLSKKTQWDKIIVKEKKKYTIFVHVSLLTR